MSVLFVFRIIWTLRQLRNWRKIWIQE